MNMNNKKTTPLDNTNGANTIVLWLKRIFSIKVLGFIVALASLWFAYEAFIREKPGELTIYCPDKRFDKSITTVYYGFELSSDTIDIWDLPSFIQIANLTGRPMEDVTIVVIIPQIIDLGFLYTYKCLIEEKEHQIPEYTLALKMDRLGAMSHLPFPIIKLFPKKNETLFLPVQIGVLSGGSDEAKNFFIKMVGIPHQNNKEEFESAFIDAIRSHLLAEKNPDEVAIEFDGIIIESPSNLNLLKNKETSVHHLKQLE